jgi:hypothetical protein
VNKLRTIISKDYSVREAKKPSEEGMKEAGRKGGKEERE